MSSTEKKYNESLAMMYQYKTGNLMTLQVDKYILDQLAHIQEGGKIMVRFLTPEQRENFAKRKGKTAQNYKTPAASLDVISPEDVAAFEANFAAKAQAQADGI